MKVTGSTIQQLDKGKDGRKPKGKCSDWKLWATTEQGRKSRRFHGTWTQATQALGAFVAELEGIVPNAETFGAYAASWARWRAESGELAPGTVANDKRALAAFSRAGMDTWQMDSITPEMCREALLWIKSNPVRGGAKLSNTYMNKLHVTLSAIFAQAVDDGRLARSPMRGIRAPKPDTKEKDALSPAEFEDAIAKVSTLPLDGRSMAIWLMLLGGLRRGEACGLYDSDVHDGCIFVTRAVKERTGEIGDPKTHKGKRVVPMPPLLASKVDEWRALRVRLGFGDSITLCCNTEGGVLRPQDFQQWWAGRGGRPGKRDEIGMPGFGFHQFRHSNLSALARHVSPFDLQKYAGWSSLAPAKVYIHDDLDALTSGVMDAFGSFDAPKTHQQEKRPGD